MPRPYSSQPVGVETSLKQQAVNMKLEVAVVLLLSGWTLSLPHKQRMQLRRHELLSAQGADRFNFIDLELLQRAAEVDAGNVVLSPTSAKTALAMLFEGADGQSSEEIASAMRLRSGRREQQDQLHQYQYNLTARSAGMMSNAAVPTPGSTLEVASQVFASERVHVKPSYEAALHHYRATVQTVNMTDPHHTAGLVNKWVSDATHGHIPSLVQPESLSESSLMILANAVFFKGTWQVEFDPKMTRDECFYVDSNHECLRVKMMETTANFRSKLVPSLESTLIELPYDDGRFSMLLLLPDRRDGIKDLIRDLACCGNLLQVLNDMEESEYIVSIPKFSIEFHTDLVPVLNKLGIMDIFSASANLSRMVKQEQGKAEPVVSNVFHKAKISVDERGAVAAGASGALVVPLMGGPPPKFRADHPFLFFIRDTRTGSFLFAGRVSRPQSEQESAEATPMTTNRAAAMPSANKEPNINFPSSNENGS